MKYRWDTTVDRFHKPISSKTSFVDCMCCHVVVLQLKCIKCAKAVVSIFLLMMKLFRNEAFTILHQRLDNKQHQT